MDTQVFYGQVHLLRALETALAGKHSIGLVDFPDGMGEYFHYPKIDIQVFFPCLCGWYLHPEIACYCGENEINQQISNLINARLDIYIKSNPHKSANLEKIFKGDTKIESWGQIKQRVEESSDFDNLELSQDCRVLLKAAKLNMPRLGMGQIRRIIKVARTIANLSHSPTIEAAHLAEAIAYRVPQ